MSDFQYAPNMSDPVAQLRLAMDRMNGKSHLTHIILVLCGIHIKDT